MSTSKSMTKQQVTFVDGNADIKYEVISDLSTPISGANNELPLNDFFERPIKVDYFEWPQGLTPFEYTFNPWRTFFTEARVANRIAHYKRLRAKLHMKVTITGNGFYYGRLLCGYTPRALDDQLTVFRPSNLIDLVGATQRPYILLDPTTSTGGEMVFPFIHPSETLDVSAPAELDQMGTVTFSLMNGLRHVNGATDGVYITIFLWATEVELSGSTNYLAPGLLPQSGKNDEYGNRLVSKTASIVSKVSGRLKDAPTIGPYALATQNLATMVGNMAYAMGYSKPQNVAPVNRMRLEQPGNMASIDGEDISTKLTYDSKQETTVDTRIMGLGGDDELPITSISTRQTFIGSALYDYSFGSGFEIWNCPVTPNLWRKTGSPSEYHLTAMAYAAAPFEYWRGTIRFRFQIVASAYHRGRLRVIYDPNGVYVAQPMNTGYSYVIDLAEERDFVMDVGWTANTGFLRFGSIVDQDQPVNTLIAPDNILRDYCNGAVRVEVMSALSSPSDSTDPVYMNIYASTTDDFEVASPTCYNIDQLTPLGPQSGLIPQSGTIDMHEGSVECEPCITQSSVVVAAPPGVPEKALMTYSGEVITSFRQMLKRYSYNRTQICRFGYQADTFPTYPVFPGLDPTGYETGTLGRCNSASMTPLGWTLMSYLAYRGGIRLLLAYDSSNAAGVISASNMSIEGVTDQRRTVWALVDGLDDITSRPENSRRLLRLAHQGASISDHNQNNVLCVEVPYYSKKKFLFGRRKDQTGIGNADKFRLIRTTISQRTALTNTSYAIYTSIGEDFQVGMYLGPPILYKAFYPPTEYSDLTRP